MDLLYVIVFLILLLTINSILSPIVVKEYFAVNDALNINVFTRLGRNFTFPYFGKTPFTASQRAILETKVLSNPIGKCALIGNTRGPLNDSFSIVHEDSIFYTLKKSCFSMNITGYRFRNDGKSLILSVAINNKENIENVTKFLLLNPLFVEFSVGTNMSFAYILHNQSRQFLFMNSKTRLRGYKTNTKAKFFDLEFAVAVPYKHNLCDRAFDYKRFSPSQGPLTEKNMQNIKDGLIHIWVYYLDENGNNFQKTGRELIVPRNKQSSMVIFDTNYKSLAGDPYKIDIYEFMNNYAIMYHNLITPVLTFSFDFSIPREEVVHVNILSCDMDTTYRSCWHNIMAIDLHGNAKGYILVVVVDTGSKCGYSGYGHPKLVIPLPFLSPNTVMNATLTIGVNQKHMYIQWTDINTGDIGKKCVYAKSIQPYVNTPFNVCNYFNPDTKRNTTVMNRIFSSKKLNPRPPLGNTTLKWNEKYVKRVNSVSFGYKNFNHLYAEK